MSREPFTLRLEPEVQAFMAALPPVPRRQLERDLEKLASRGMQVLPPLTGALYGPVWELRSRVEGFGRYRLFYYRDGDASFHVFIRRAGGLVGVRLPFRGRR
jgi:Phage derived protein Gp49-like (DUF891)